MKKNTKVSTTCMLLLCAISFLTTSIIVAQESSIYRVYDDNQSSNILSRSSETRDIPRELLNGLNSAIYVENSRVINTTGIGRAKVIKLLDSNSIHAINSINEVTNNVELLTISLQNMSNLSMSFNMDSLDLPSLRYIYLKCDFDCSESQIRQFLVNLDPEVTIFYKVLKRS
ncbi:hypothetical protein [Mangrovimonas cancribranchiae]|uniref:DUF4476 domain-containing protein n=1 Tax=Mangrovimonas cancribranchiae TaxID=3080055 RepID=A0AAU6P2Z8_9FLAO